MAKWSNTLKMFAATAASALVLTACANDETASTSTESEAKGSDTASSSAESSAAEAEEASLWDQIELSDDKPEVAPVEPNNSPNRIVMNLTEDPATSMAFNWYTTDKVDGSMVRVSTKEDLSDATEFPADVKEVTSEYAERTKDGYYIYARTTMDEDDKFIVDENGEPEEILGYFTDEQLTTEHLDWTADGDEYGYLFLQDVTEHTNKATATGLEPNTQYYYQIGSEKEGWSDTGSFRTATDDSEGFQFIHYTDTQNAYWNANIQNEAEYGADTLKNALKTAPDADFALHTGDFVEIAQVEDEWVDNLDMSVEYNLTLPHAYVPGNHDEYVVQYQRDIEGKGKDLDAFNEHTNVPITDGATSGGSYYSFDYNNAHFVVLNTNDNKESEDNPAREANNIEEASPGAIGKKQMDWAKKDIEDARAAGADWIILTYHKPVYSASYHSLQDEDVQVTREEFVKLADELGVDVVLQGHDHNLTRTKSLTYTGDNFAYANVEDTEKETIDGVDYHVNPEGVTYVIPNTSGTKAYDAIYQKGVEHVHTVRPKLDWMTEEDVELWNGLFDLAEQPEKSPKYEKKHDNYRQNHNQAFSVYTVTPDTFKIDIYLVQGDLKDGADKRTVTLHNSHGIIKK